MGRSRVNPHKYGAKATVVDGIRFASKAEAKRYGELKLLKKAGKVSDLTLQPRFRLSVIGLWGQAVEIGAYVADFRYFHYGEPDAPGVLVIEDVKGMKTDMYRWKKKHFEAQYGIRITEIR